MKEDIKKEIKLVEGVTAEVDGALLKIKGPKGEVERDFRHPRVKVGIKEGKIFLEAMKSTKREKTVIGSFESHIKNIVWGVQEPHVYELKICSGHFPMNVTVSGQELIIKNFLGEAVPRKVKLISGGDIKVDGDKIIITSPNKEVAGQNAAKIEQLCRITNRDRRIFQDGCYIINKAGKEL